MSAPAGYAGTAIFDAAVGRFSGALDPQRWSERDPEIWRQSYRIAGAPGAHPRSLPPPSAPPSKKWGLASGYFFEDVVVLGFEYRNILTTSYEDAALDPGKPRIRFDYAQHECLSTESSRTEDGGIDVDNGFTECVPLPPDPGGRASVQVSISKSVRFTRPSFCVDEVNLVAHALVPLTLDTWLHNLLFDR